MGLSSSGAGIVSVIVGTAIGLFVYGAIFPTAVSSMSATAAWGTAGAAVITLGTTVVSIGCIYAVLKKVIGF